MDDKEDKKKLKKELSDTEKIERSLITTYKHRIWRKFTKALIIYDLIKKDDHICVCISGGKDSMLLALLFKHLQRYSEIPFKVSYLVMNPGYNEINAKVIKDNLELLQIPARIVSTDIFEIANSTSRKPCYLCAKMRRGALYRIAKDMGCNKIALGHHYDDVIDTTLMNMLNAGSFQTMLPKLHSDHYGGMEVIRPMYLIREPDIISFKNYNHLNFIQCACRFTENIDKSLNKEGDSQRAKTKALIARLVKEYSPVVEKNIFQAACNVNLDMVLGYKSEGVEHSFLDDYEEKGKELDSKIENEGIEKASIEKAKREHKELEIDDTFNFLKEE
jgi:tRNA(Ile)-lysidine synthase TilS/MesJ